MLATRILKPLALSTKRLMSQQVAVVLAGSGVYDGSEIQEASSALIHLSRAGAEVKCFAPDKEQFHVVDHTKGEEDATNRRNVMVESARICRGAIAPLSDLKDAEGFVKRVWQQLHHGATILVAWHHGEIHDLLRALLDKTSDVTAETLGL